MIHTLSLVCYTVGFIATIVVIGLLTSFTWAALTAVIVLMMIAGAAGMTE